MDHFLGLWRRDITLTIGLPQPQPDVKMPCRQPQAGVLERQRTNEIRRPAGETRPKLADFSKMRRPIMNVLVENPANQLVLSDIRVKMPQQNGERFSSASPVVKALTGLIHVGLLTAPFKLRWEKMYFKYIFT